MPRRHDLGYTSHLAQSLDNKYIVEEVDMTDTIPKIKKAHATHGWSPTNIPMSWPRGLISWIMPQEKDQGGGQQQGGQQGGQSGGGGGGGPGGKTGPIGLDDNQPKGPSGEGYMRGIGTNNHLATGAPSDPRDICILGDKKDDQSKTAGGGGGGSGGGGGGGGGGGEDNGGRPGDTVLYGREKETGPTQIHISNLKDNNFKPGCYMTTRKENCLKFQLVDVQDDQSSGGGGGGASAQSRAAAPSGGGGGGGGGSSGGSKSKGQRPLLKKESDTHITIVGDTITIKRGKGTVIVSDSKVIGFLGDEKKSFRVDGQHTHIRYGDNSIWVDSSGCWSSKEIQQKMCTDS